MDSAGPHEAWMPADEVRRRAIAGAGVVGIQGIALRLLGLGGTVVLARLLLPRDFGLVAFGLTLVTFGGFLANGGIAAALVRRTEPPEPDDLQAFLALQLAVTIALTGATAAVAWSFGETGWLVVLMVASLPLTVFRTPGAILLERQLRYHPLALVQVSETVAYFGWAIATVASGWGVWGLASATVVRAAVGTAAMAHFAPLGLLAPRPSWRRIREPLGFGIRFQGAGLGYLLRDQGINMGTAAIGGLSVLGLWGLAARVMQVPFLLFESLWRVSYPAMSRLLGAGEDPRPVIERGIAVVSIATGVVLTALVGAGPALIPSVFGDQWAAASDVIPWASLGLIISGPVSVASAGYLYAVGDASTVLRSSLLNGIAWAAVALSLLPLIGVAALGVGWLASALVEAFILGRAVVAGTGARLLAHLAVPAAAAAAAGAAGWLLASSIGHALVGSIVGAALAEALYLGALILLRRPLLTDTFILTGRALRGSLAWAR
jgi:O-antigen/teichoic acid export membrane protein